MAVLGGTFALALSGAAKAQDYVQNGSLAITSIPTITGAPAVGNVLVAGGGRWQSPNVRATNTRWEWWRCNNAGAIGCDKINVTNASWPYYRLADEDANKWIATARYVQLGSASVLMASSTTGPVRPRVTPTPVPTPVVTPEPTPVVPEPTPAPPATFEVAAAPTATPVPTAGQVLHQASTRRVMKPAPVVRMSGELTTNGANVTVLSIRAPRAAKITVRCTGPCPRKSWSTSGTRKRQLTRASAFERPLASGTKLSVSITRRGYIGKRTVFTIRLGKAPLRRDSCLSSSGRSTKCPAG